MMRHPKSACSARRLCGISRVFIPLLSVCVSAAIFLSCLPVPMAPCLRHYAYDTVPEVYVCRSSHPASYADTGQNLVPAHARLTAACYVLLKLHSHVRRIRSACTPQLMLHCMLSATYAALHAFTGLPALHALRSFSALHALPAECLPDYIRDYIRDYIPQSFSNSARVSSNSLEANLYGSSLERSTPASFKRDTGSADEPEERNAM